VISVLGIIDLLHEKGIEVAKGAGKSEFQGSNGWLPT
jgi:hypothetical protein